MVIAAGSVMREPRIGPTVMTVIQKAPRVPPSKPAIRSINNSASRRIGRVDANTMMTTTKAASVILTP